MTAGDICNCFAYFRESSQIGTTMFQSDGANYFKRNGFTNTAIRWSALWPFGIVTDSAVMLVEAALI